MSITSMMPGVTYANKQTRTTKQRYLNVAVILVNALSLLCGIAIVGLGIALFSLVVNDSALVFLGLRFDGPAFVVIGVGIFIVLLSLFACCGTIDSHRAFLVSHAALLGTFVLFQVIIVSAALFVEPKLESTWRQWMNSSVKYYRHDSNFVLRGIWDRVHKALQCCGAYGPQDFVEFYGGVPLSCCEGDVTDLEWCNTIEAYQLPCVEAVGLVIDDNITNIYGLFLCTFMVEVISVILTLCLLQSRKEN